MKSIEDVSKRMLEESEKELEYARRLEETARSAKNPVVKAVLEAVSKDSVKHSSIYKALAELLMHPSLVWEEEAEQVRKKLEEHVEEEAEAVKELEELLRDERITGNPAAKFLVEMLLRDENFHHALMEKIYEAVVETRKFTEEELWDMVWKEAMWHGAPGG
jgi:rubrerythrin